MCECMAVCVNECVNACMECHCTEFVDSLVSKLPPCEYTVMQLTMIVVICNMYIVKLGNVVIGCSFTQQMFLVG